MEIRNPDMAPVRFYKPNYLPDYSSYFPNMDNIVPRTKYIEGISPSDHYTDWLINKEMFFQFSIMTSGTESVYLYKLGSSGFALYDTLLPTDITPDDWESESINRYNKNFTEEGVYYYDIPTALYRSDKFVVHSDEYFRRRLVEIVYYNSENDYGMVFFDGDTQRYTGRAYFSGVLLPDTPGNDIAAFVTDRGEVIKGSSTPVKRAILKLADVHYADINRVNAIFSCDNITINGITYQNQKAPQAGALERTDTVDITVELTQTNYIYYTE